MKRLSCVIAVTLVLCLLAGCLEAYAPGTTHGSTPSNTVTQSTTTAPSVTQPTQSTAQTTAPTTVPSTAPTVPTTAPTQPPVLEDIVSLDGDFYTYDKMAADLQGLALRYPDKLSYRSYGQSADGRELYVATMGNPDAPKQVLITAGMHAREYINPYLVMLQMEYYLQNYDTVSFQGRTFSELFDQVAFVVVPMTNPDGLTLTQEGIEAIRSPQLQNIIRSICAKKGVTEAGIDQWVRTYWKSNAAGVDLNRNFDALWNEHIAEPSGATATEPAHEYYKGPTANSEPETYHLIALTESLSNPITSVCVHSRGQIIYWRCFQEGDFEQENYVLAKIAKSVTGYGIVDENQTEPSFSNWTILAHDIPTITVETGAYIAYPHHIGNMIGTIYEQNRDLWAAIAAAYL